MLYIVLRLVVIAYDYLFAENIRAVVYLYPPRLYQPVKTYCAVQSLEQADDMYILRRRKLHACYGNYPVSDKGKTYGSALLSEIVGHEPDLISAVGTDGQAGYVKYEDVKKPEIKNPSEAVSYMQDRLETYTVPLYDLQEEVIGEFEIGCAMDVTGYSLEEAKEMVNLGERAGSVLSVEQTSLINGNFPKNVRGETYGTALMAEVVGEMPDLQAAIGTNDQEGYVRTSDLSHPKFETPQDALEWQKTQPDSYYIPLYDFQGNEIGSFLRERNNLTIAEMEAMKG